MCSNKIFHDYKKVAHSKKAERLIYTIEKVHVKKNK